jgi:Fe-S cluster assembly iron-binding protein IscA
MLQLTPEATSHLVRVRGERGLGQKTGARFVENGPGVGLTFASRPEPGDRVVEADGIAIYLAPEVADKLDGGTVDVGDKNGKTALYFRLPPRDKGNT